MKRRQLITCLPTFFGFLAVTRAQETHSQQREHAALVSLIRLIATPRDFDGLRVRVLGYLGEGGGLDRSVGLYVSEADGHNSILSNLVALKVDERDVRALLNRYVLVEGTYRAPQQNLSSYNGYIEHVTDLKSWTTGDPGLRPKR
jgi:hypothetical protein